MDVLVERCAGIDLSKTDAKVCVRVHSPGKRLLEGRDDPEPTAVIVDSQRARRAQVR
jgi:hypothetical protein